MQKAKNILDILGPVMIGPSSSHTAGAVRLGLLAGKIFGEKLNSVTLNLYNSFARTGFGHGTQNALIAGLLGLKPDNQDIINSFKLAQQSGLNYSFNYFDDYNRHPNAVDFIMKNANLTLVVKGASLGAGEILIDDINGFSFNLKGDFETLLLVYKDTPGMIYKVTNLIQSKNINIASMVCDRSAKGKLASMGICLDSKLNQDILYSIKNIENMSMIRLVEKLGEL